MTMRWLASRSGVISALVVVAFAGCTCPEARVTDTGYADMASYGAAIAVCVAGRDCRPLCASVFSLDDSARIEHCRIRSVVHADLTTQPAPIDPAAELQSVVGVNLAVMYSQRETCGDGAYSGDGTPSDGWTDDDWGDVDPGDDGSCDDGSCDPDPGDDGGCDDGSCDGDDGSTDEPGDDQPGDDGGWDDGGGGDDGGDDGGGDDGGGDGGDGLGGRGGVRRSHRAPVHAPAAQAGHVLTRPTRR